MILTEKPPRTSPIDFARCPVHHQLVARDGFGRFLGKCSGCAGEAADGLIALRRQARGVTVDDVLLGRTARLFSERI